MIHSARTHIARHPPTHTRRRAHGHANMHGLRRAGPMRFDRFDRKEAGWTVGGRPVQPASGGRLGRCGPPQPAQLCRLSRPGLPTRPVLPEASRRPGRPPGPLRPAAGRFDRDGAAPPRPDDGAIPSRSLRAVFASPIRRRSPTKKLRSPRFTTTRQFKLPP